MSCCIQFLKWNALSLYFYLKNSFSKSITSYKHLIFKNEINNIFPSQKSFLLLSSDTNASFANKPIKFCHSKPNTWRHVFVVVVYVLPSTFSYTNFLLSVFFPNSEGCIFILLRRVQNEGSYVYGSGLFQDGSYKTVVFCLWLLWESHCPKIKNHCPSRCSLLLWW